MDISKQLTYNDIKSENAFSLSWLKEQHMKCNFKCTKLIKNKTFTRFMNAITPTKATWNGCNASGWREDIFTVNGFNEEMHYGGQDREFGERMFNLGIKSKQIRYSAIVLHLDHKRPYKTKESIERISISVVIHVKQVSRRHRSESNNYIKKAAGPHVLHMGTGTPEKEEKG